MKRLSYRKSGVNIDRANSLIDKIKPLVAQTKRKGWLGNIGGFAGFFKLNLKHYKDPILVGATDGVGTKLLLAQQFSKHDTVGVDLVAMCVNDLISCGAEPLFFLDYFASGKLKNKAMKDVVKGIVDGCKQAQVALIGGETAELPGMYRDGIYDIAGFSVGIVDRKKIINGSGITAGDLILGIQSSGIHSNGYSLVRKIFSKKDLKSKKLREEILKPTIIYVKAIKDVLKSCGVKAISHITGGGFYDNIIRVLPEKKLASVIFGKSWDIPWIFKVMQKKAKISYREMHRTFNMGIGMVLVIKKQDLWKAKKILEKNHKLKSWLIGEIIKGKKRVEIIDL